MAKSCLCLALIAFILLGLTRHGPDWWHTILVVLIGIGVCGAWLAVATTGSFKRWP